MTKLGSFGVSAESRVVAQPVPVKSIVVELNDDFFNRQAITIPNGTATTLILKNKALLAPSTVEKLGIDAEVQAGKEKNHYRATERHLVHMNSYAGTISRKEWLGEVIVE